MEIVTTKVINTNAIYDRIQKQTSGSVVLHFAVVREKTGNETTSHVELKRNGDIKSELRSITEAIYKKWQVEDVLIIRRLGILKVGEVISLVAASSPHREDAFDACRFGVESLKKMKTIAKTER